MHRLKKEKKATSMSSPSIALLKNQLLEKQHELLNHPFSLLNR